MAKTNYKSVDEYISTFSKDIQEKLNKLRKIINEEIPDRTETISYQIPCIKVNGKFVIYFSGWKNHISLYPIPPGPEEFKQEIKPFIKGKGTLQFPYEKELPFNLIKKIATYSKEAHANRQRSY